MCMKSAKLCPSKRIIVGYLLKFEVIDSEIVVHVLSSYIFGNVRSEHPWNIFGNPGTRSEDENLTHLIQEKLPGMKNRFYENNFCWILYCREANDRRENPNNVKLPPLKKIHKVDKRYEELVEAQKNQPPVQRRQVRLPKM